MKEVTDPEILKQLETAPNGLKPVTDPEILAKLQRQVPMSLMEIGRQAVRNFPSSAVSTGRSLVTPFLHPIQTGKGLFDIARGGLERGAEALGMEPTTREFEPSFDAVVKMFKNRYGSVENLKRTIATDPVGVAMDVSTAISGIGASVRAAGLTGVAGGLEKAARAVNPVSQAIKIAKPILGKVSEKTLGTALGITTGVQGPAIKTAFTKGGPQFVSAMRGATDEGTIIKTMRDTMNEIRQMRSSAYRERLEAIKELPQQLPFNPIKSEFEKSLKEFNIRKTEVGDLDFSTSFMARAGESSIKEVAEDLKIWERNLELRTPLMLDGLKKRIDDLITNRALQDNTSVILTRMRNAVRETLVERVPGYRQMISDYEKSTRDIEEIQKALAIKPRTGADTILKKLNSAMREDPAFRRSLIEKMEKTTGRDLIDMLAGYSFSSWFPRGAIARLFGAGELIGGLTGKTKYWKILLMGSPRVVGETTRWLGMASRELRKLPLPPSQYLYQAGRGVQQLPQEMNQ